jgi:hypothetical protein
MRDRNMPEGWGKNLKKLNGTDSGQSFQDVRI